MAGLAVAAVLAERFDRVTIVERDTLPDGDQHRRGVPQGRHVHALLPAGLEALTGLLPGLVDDLTARGAQLLEPSAFRFHIGGGCIYPVDYGRQVIDATRPLVEAVVRARVRELPGVGVVEACDARGLVTDRDRRRVRGVRLLRRADSGAEEILTADLVVDTTGRGSRSPRWLADLGYAPPAEESVPVDIHYATRYFRHRAEDLDGATQILVARSPQQRRGGVAQVVEGQRWQVTLAGFLGERPPTDLEGFAAYAGSLSTGDLHAIVSGSEPIGDAATASYPANTRRRYDRLRRFPEGYVVAGDALCSFNPVYGQGMSVAAQEAAVLATVLDRDGLDRVGQRFFRRSRRVVDVAWTLAVGSDLADPAVEGPRTAQWRLVDAYLRRLVPVAHRDPAVALAFLHVIGLVAAPESLMRPRILWRVLTGGRPPRTPPSTLPVPVTPATEPRTLDR
jgi:2-polyprenyl-6-methoxyphenol hydroxylase-like FAD-dependent oxidoreductase